MAAITFTPDSNLTSEFERIIARLRKPSPVNREVIADAIRESIAENFRRESGDGAEWPQLAAMTVAQRQEHGYPGEHPMLVRSGSLLDSLTNPNNADHIEKLTATNESLDVEIGSLDSRVIALDRGLGNVPARPFLALDEQQIDRVGDAIEAYFDALFSL